ncbi:unnamed protein product [Amoebophrya sp. A25]|nr:unnamed protein product [Amoebophrya sp. A25]|eukprot:GSA25T00009309001.1
MSTRRRQLRRRYGSIVVGFLDSFYTHPTSSWDCSSTSRCLTSIVTADEGTRTPRTRKLLSFLRRPARATSALQRKNTLVSRRVRTRGDLRKLPQAQGAKFYCPSLAPICEEDDTQEMISFADSLSHQDDHDDDEEYPTCWSPIREDYNIDDIEGQVELEEQIRRTGAASVLSSIINQHQHDHARGAGRKVVDPKRVPSCLSLVPPPSYDNRATASASSSSTRTAGPSSVPIVTIADDFHDVRRLHVDLLDYITDPPALEEPDLRHGHGAEQPRPPRMSMTPRTANVTRSRSVLMCGHADHDERHDLQQPIAAEIDDDVDHVGHTLHEPASQEPLRPPRRNRRITDIEVGTIKMATVAEAVIFANGRDLMLDGRL